MINLLTNLGILYLWTWPIWPFILVFSFTFGLTGIIKDEHDAGKNLIIAAFALLVILAGVIAPNL